jgi:beta-N-acetylhexosaminidase
MSLDVPAHFASLVCVGFHGDEPTPFMEEAFSAGVSTVILFARNVGDPVKTSETCRRLREAAGRPIVIAIDQEGGSSRRLVDGFTPVPSMRELARLGPVAVAEAAATTARELKSVGIDFNFAPVVDVDSNPDNPVIGDRAFSNDPKLVAELGSIWIKAMQRESVAACAKHFPGHGDTSEDSHLELPRLAHDLDRLRRIELPPFVSAVEAGVASIMSAHVLFEAVDPDRPATLSRTVLQDVLRGELGFKGVIVSDDLEMDAIVGRMPIESAAIEAINAGVDLLLCCHREDRQKIVLESLADGLNPSMAERAVERMSKFHAAWAR